MLSRCQRLKLFGDQSEKEFIGYLDYLTRKLYKFLVFSVYFFFVLSLTNLANSWKLYSVLAKGTHRKVSVFAEAECLRGSTALKGWQELKQKTLKKSLKPLPPHTPESTLSSTNVGKCKETLLVQQSLQYLLRTPVLPAPQADSIKTLFLTLREAQSDHLTKVLVNGIEW